jgi:hypothetical protein
MDGFFKECLIPWAKPPKPLGTPFWRQLVFNGTELYNEMASGDGLSVINYRVHPYIERHISI